MPQNKPRLIAFYLPQYHPIPENDKWWGKGFTEWTNVAKAKPLFRGHYQPHLPADLGFYDLRVPEVREAQAQMAKEAGIEGFCYWHYWFGDGKRLLERPFNEVLASGKPDFPFCLAWANENWTGVWHGCPNRVLAKQEYPGREDYRAHFMVLLSAFKDKRYLSIGGKKIFIVFKPDELPDPDEFVSVWQRLAKRHGLGGFYFIGWGDGVWRKPLRSFDAAILHPPLRGSNKILFRLERDKANWLRPFKKVAERVGHRLGPERYNYRAYTKIAENFFRNSDERYFPCVIPNWDNTPRTGRKGIVLMNSNPGDFENHLRQMVDLAKQKIGGGNVLFLKSWNEWAEGNYLEPDQRNELDFLDVVAKYKGKKI